MKRLKKSRPASASDAATSWAGEDQADSWSPSDFEPTPFPAESYVLQRQLEQLRRRLQKRADDAAATTTTEGNDSELDERATAGRFAVEWLEAEQKPLPDSSFFHLINDVAIEDLYARYAGQLDSSCYQDVLLAGRTALVHRLLQRELLAKQRQLHNTPVRQSAMDLSSSSSPSLLSDSATAESSTGSQLLLSDYLLLVDRKGKLRLRAVLLTSNAIYLTKARRSGELGVLQRTRTIWFENVRGVSLLSRHGSNFFALHVFKGVDRIRPHTDYLLWSSRKHQLLWALSLAVRSCLNVPLRASVTSQLHCMLNAHRAVDLRVVELPLPEIPAKVLRYATCQTPLHTIETTVRVSRPSRRSST